MKHILLSIHPVFASAIIARIKLYEFRKKFPVDYSGRVYVYATNPIKKIIGYFKTRMIEKDSTESLFAKYGAFSSISKVDFFIYYGEMAQGIVIHIGDVIGFHYGVNPLDFSIKPPQNYRFLSDEQIQKIDAKGETNA